MQQSGVEAAIQELEKDVKRVQEAIAVLKKIQSQRASDGAATRGPKRRLSAKARRRIAEAAKKRWAAIRAAKGQSAKAKA